MPRILFRSILGTIVLSTTLRGGQAPQPIPIDDFESGALAG